MSTHILGFAGSLRKASVNVGLLRAAQTVLPADTALEIFDLTPLPLYNEDVYQLGLPESVKHFKERIQAADALLIATPEYNYSMPGVLKNAIDWASRPPNHSPLNDKPVAIIGAGGGAGTARAQYHLRQVCVFTNMHPLNKPEVQIGRAYERFDKDGNPTDPEIKEHLTKLIEALVIWTARLKK